MIDEISRIIYEEMEKAFSTAIGVLVSIMFGGAVVDSVLTVSFDPFLAYMIEMVTKVSIAVVSGVCTYLAIYGVKKLFNHDKTNP